MRLSDGRSTDSVLATELLLFHLDAKNQNDTLCNPSFRKCYVSSGWLLFAFLTLPRGSEGALPPHPFSLFHPHSLSGGCSEGPLAGGKLSGLLPSLPVLAARSSLSAGWRLFLRFIGVHRGCLRGQTFPSNSSSRSRSQLLLLSSPLLQSSVPSLI